MKYIYFLNYSHKKGFTVTELLVVMAIGIVIITSIVFQQSKWNDHLALKTQSYQATLNLRQAQINSLGVKEYFAGNGNKFDNGYGVSFDSTNNMQYIYFVDLNKNLKYDSGESVETTILNRGVYIYKVCGFFNGAEQCSNGGGAISSANVSFFRPSPNANISILNSGNQVLPNIYPPLKIYFRSNQGRENYIKIEENGDVSLVE